MYIMSKKKAKKRKREDLYNGSNRRKITSVNRFVFIHQFY